VVPASVPIPAARARTRIRRRVLDWYAATARPLAFRATSDPWAILVSEVMAQQTQAARAADAWTRFMARYPTPAALAAASPGDVLRAWRGLGYNRRAIALQRAAAAIVAEHGGRVPSDLEALRRLPGIGPYSARAVAALAFGQRVGAVDTNVRRVLGRAFFGSSPDAGSLQELADALVPRRRPGLWTHAVMDIGATLCRIRHPRCPDCPMRAWCRYAAAVEATPPPVRPATARGPGFRASSRWLRGRILDRLRDLDDGAWSRFDGPIGDHDVAAIDAALRSLATDGLLELRDGRFPEARLPGG
jgi:A/G-specific adenine glycosylase